jgi:hypothetical protein
VVTMSNWLTENISFYMAFCVPSVNGVDGLYFSAVEVLTLYSRFRERSTSLPRTSHIPRQESAYPSPVAEAYQGMKGYVRNGGMPPSGQGKTSPGGRKLGFGGKEKVVANRYLPGHRQLQANAANLVAAPQQALHRANRSSPYGPLRMADHQSQPNPKGKRGSRKRPAYQGQVVAMRNLKVLYRWRRMLQIQFVVYQLGIPSFIPQSQGIVGSPRPGAGTVTGPEAEGQLAGLLKAQGKEQIPGSAGKSLRRPSLSCRRGGWDQGYQGNTENKAGDTPYPFAPNPIYIREKHSRKLVLWLTEIPDTPFGYSENSGVLLRGPFHTSVGLMKLNKINVSSSLYEAGAGRLARAD